MRIRQDDDLPRVLQQRPAIPSDSPSTTPEKTTAADPTQTSAVTSSLLPIKRKLLLAALFGLIATGLFYPVENVVTASGQVIPSDRVQTVQHLEGGIVTAVHVREGQAVKQGQPLLEIDLGGSSLNPEQLTARLPTAQAV